MIKLVFTQQREVLQFIIDKRVITYVDRLWKNPIQVIPKDEKLLQKVRMSRNRVPQMIHKWIIDANSGKNKEEYDACKNDEELSEIIIRDARLKGCKLQKVIKDAS